MADFLYKFTKRYMDEIWLTSEGTSRLKGFYKSITLSLIKNKHFYCCHSSSKEKPVYLFFTKESSPIKQD